MQTDPIMRVFELVPALFSAGFVNCKAVNVQCYDCQRTWNMPGTSSFLTIT